MRKFILKVAPALIIGCYGMSMYLTFSQMNAVGVEASVFRFIAWQIVFVFLIAQSHRVDESHEDHKRRMDMELENGILRNRVEILEKRMPNPYARDL